MNTSLVKTLPPGDFEEISVLKAGWEARLFMLVSQNRPIKFDVYPRPNFFEEIKSRLPQQAYTVLILENDRWLHFLVPLPK